MPNKQAYTKLSNGIEMPMMGLGVYDMYNQEAEQAVLDALEIGYRLIDTAAMYKNETEIGNAIRKSGLSRNELFITTKLNNTEHGFDSTLKAFDESLKKNKCRLYRPLFSALANKGKKKGQLVGPRKIAQRKKSEGDWGSQLFDSFFGRTFYLFQHDSRAEPD